MTILVVNASEVSWIFTFLFLLLGILLRPALRWEEGGFTLLVIVSAAFDLLPAFSPLLNATS
jgi:hypothetical protein